MKSRAHHCDHSIILTKILTHTRNDIIIAGNLGYQAFSFLSSASKLSVSDYCTLLLNFSVCRQLKKEKRKPGMGTRLGMGYTKMCANNV